MSSHVDVSRRPNGFLRRQRLASQREDGELLLRLEFGGDVRVLDGVRVHVRRARLRLADAALSRPAAAAAAAAVGPPLNRHACTGDAEHDATINPNPLLCEYYKAIRPIYGTTYAPFDHRQQTPRPALPALHGGQPRVPSRRSSDLE